MFNHFSLFIKYSNVRKQEVVIVRHRRTQGGGVSGVKPPLEEWCSVIYTVHGNK